MCKVSRMKYVFHITIYFGIVYVFISGLKWKNNNKSWKYLHDDIYHRAHNYVYLQKFKFWFLIYLTIYDDDYQIMYVYNCIKIVSGIMTPINTTVDNNWKHLLCEFQLQTKVAKWLVLKKETMNNDILVHIYHSINKLSKPRLYK